MIKIVLKDYAVLRGIPYAFGEKIKASLTYANPAYQAKEKAGQWIPQDMPKYIYLYGEHNGSIYVPKGCMNTIIGECVKQNIPYEILDRTVAPAIEKIDFVSTLRDYQELATKDMLEKRYGFLEAATGSGKCLGKGTPIILFDGTTKLIEDIVVGDLLMGPDSLPRKVKTLARGTENMFKISPTKGTPYTVNESHILSLKMSGNRHPKDTIINIDIKSYLSKNNNFKHCAKGWRTGVQFQEKPINSIISPYILGVWLGDGTNTGPSISNPDIEIIKELQTYAKNVGIGLKSYYPEKRCPEHSFTDGQRGAPNIFLNELRRLNLINNKHIPSMFKINSERIRLEVLAGLIDTDGYGGAGGYDLISKYKQLAEDILFLARSVGLAAYISESWKKCQGWTEKRLYYRISISGNCHIIPCRVARKKATVRKQKKDALKTGITVTPVGIGEYFGFELEDSDGLFLLGDFTVTHNTAMGIYVITARSVRTLVLVHNKELVDQWKEALHKHTNIKKIGTMGGGKLDIQDVTVGIINSVSRHVAELKDKIGLLVVDEAHRCAGPSYITTLNSMNPKFMLGLSATPYRRDNTTNIIFQMIGPKMHVVSKKYLEDTGSVLVPRVVICKSTFQYSFRNDYSSMISALTVSSRRNTEIATAVASELQKYNEPIMVVSDRVSHCEDLFLLISRIPGARPVLVHGKQAAPVRKGGVAGIKDGTYNILIATSSLLSEGFDAPGLSALFMATPLKFSGRLVQIIGRILRPSGSDDKPRVYDFRDILIPTLQYMGYNRDKTYKKLGWTY